MLRRSNTPPCGEFMRGIAVKALAKLQQALDGIDSSKPAS
jgi:hypothetical protein